MRRRIAGWGLVAALCAGMASAQQVSDLRAPEGAGAGRIAVSTEVAQALAAKAAGRPVAAVRAMVVAAHPAAAEAALAVLREGGTAADAMIAAQVLLGLVEPQSSGLGGGAFLVWYDAASGTLTTLDGRETAPLAAGPELFLQPDGTPMAFFDAVLGGRSVGVPGVPALMAEAHRRWGRAGWAGLFDAAIALAEDGFEVSPRLAALVAADAARLASHPTTAAYFLPGGAPVTAGTQLRNAAYAASLRVLAAEGAEAFYSGTMAADIVAAARGAANPGLLDALDLAIYRVIDRPAVCVPFRKTELCGMGPPSSGAVAVGQILGMLDRVDLPGPQDARAWRLIGDATRLAFADRERFIGDPDHVPVPVTGLLAPAYLDARAALLRGDDALPEVAPGQPESDHGLLRRDGQTLAQPATSHISIVDGFGNALSMTSSIENAFGSRVMVGGFLLNNQLTDFSFVPQADGRLLANAVAPGKRPRSSMAPVIVLRDGAPVLVIGSPGGSRIIPYVANAIIAHLVWGLDVQQAVSRPHLVNRFGLYDVERGTGAETLTEDLRALGYEVRPAEMTSGLHAIALGPDGLQGGADPRREGVALGD